MSSPAIFSSVSIPLRSNNCGLHRPSNAIPAKRPDDPGGELAGDDPIHATGVHRRLAAEGAASPRRDLDSAGDAPPLEHTLSLTQSMYRRGFVTRMSLEADRATRRSRRKLSWRRPRRNSMCSGTTRGNASSTLESNLAVAEARRQVAAARPWPDGQGTRKYRGADRQMRNHVAAGAGRPRPFAS